MQAYHCYFRSTLECRLWQADKHVPDMSILPSILQGEPCDYPKYISTWISCSFESFWIENARKSLKFFSIFYVTLSNFKKTNLIKKKSLRIQVKSKHKKRNATNSFLKNKMVKIVACFVYFFKVSRFWFNNKNCSIFSSNFTTFSILFPWSWAVYNLTALYHNKTANKSRNPLKKWAKRRKTFLGESIHFWTQASSNCKFTCWNDFSLCKQVVKQKCLFLLVCVWVLCKHFKRFGRMRMDIVFQSSMRQFTCFVGCLIGWEVNVNDIKSR